MRVFGSPDVFRLRKEPINSLSCVRPCVRASVRSSVPVLQPRPFDIFGLSALAVKVYGFTLVRPFVRASVTPYLEIRATYFDDFLHKATS